jgi:hypothetical protein
VRHVGHLPRILDPWFSAAWECVEETLSFFAVIGGGDVTTEKGKQDLRGYKAGGTFHVNFVCVYFNVRWGLFISLCFLWCLVFNFRCIFLFGDILIKENHRKKWSHWMNYPPMLVNILRCVRLSTSSSSSRRWNLVYNCLSLYLDWKKNCALL